MADLRRVLAPQPWRLTALFAAVFAGQADASRFTLRRTGAALHPIASAWTVQGASVELALDRPLLDREVYTLAHLDSAVSLAVSYIAPVTPPRPAALARIDHDVPNDPEAEVFGLDVDWFGAQLTATRDFPVERGPRNLRHGLAVLAHTEPAELIHRPAAGLGLPQRVNAHVSDPVLQELAAEVVTAWQSDDRVREASVTFVRDPAGSVLLRSSILTPPLLGETIDFTTRL